MTCCVLFKVTGRTVIFEPDSDPPKPIPTPQVPTPPPPSETYYHETVPAPKPIPTIPTAIPFDGVCIYCSDGSSKIEPGVCKIVRVVDCGGPSGVRI